MSNKETDNKIIEGEWKEQKLLWHYKFRNNEYWEQTMVEFERYLAQQREEYIKDLEGLSHKNLAFKVQALIKKYKGQ